MNPNVSEGIYISVIGMSVVFVTLLLLFTIFKLLPIMLQMSTRSRLKKEGKEVRDDDPLHISGEVNAAISAAIYLFLEETHDDESHEMTIKRIMKIYSPWSSKIYSMNQLTK